MCNIFSISNPARDTIAGIAGPLPSPSFQPFHPGPLPSPATQSRKSVAQVITTTHTRQAMHKMSIFSVEVGGVVHPLFERDLALNTEQEIEVAIEWAYECQVRKVSQLLVT
jgi:hypothetical protein